MEIKPTKLDYSANVPCLREDCKKRDVVEQIFAERKLKVVEVYYARYMWYYVLTDDGVIWLNDFSHGGGGVFRHEQHNMFFAVNANAIEAHKFIAAWATYNFTGYVEDQPIYDQFDALYKKARAKRKDVVENINDLRKLVSLNAMMELYPEFRDSLADAFINKAKADKVK